MLKQMRQSVVCESAKSSSRHLRNFSGSLKLYQLQKFFKKIVVARTHPAAWTLDLPVSRSLEEGQTQYIGLA